MKTVLKYVFRMLALALSWLSSVPELLRIDALVLSLVLVYLQNAFGLFFFLPLTAGSQTVCVPSSLSACFCRF